MAYDYDKLYGDTPDALGAPTKVFVDIFQGFDRADARVLDVGCGQGRDALFIARLGHRVVGVDLSPNGIRDLRDAATREDLPIQGVVADVETYVPEGDFDVILIDRTLHMLAEPKRLAVLERLLNHVSPNGQVLIADEATNIPGFEAVVAESPHDWQTTFQERGYLFVRRDT